MKKIRLLYVEDSHFDRDLVKVHFEENAPDFKLEIVETGEQCFEKLKTNEYDILLLDNVLPDINGIDILKKLVNKQVNYPIVILTVEGDENALLDALRLGASDYIQKTQDYLSNLDKDLRVIYNSYNYQKDIEIKTVTSKIKILYVEHNKFDIALTQDYFSEYVPGIEIELTESTEEALIILRTRKDIDLVLCDMNMPFIDGLAFFKETRLIRIDLPFVFITGEINEEKAVPVLKLGAYDYVLKRDNYLQKLPAIIKNAVIKFRLSKREKMLSAKLNKLTDSLEKKVQTRTLTLVKEVEERKAKEKALQKSEKLLQQSERRLKEAQRLAKLGNWELDLSTNLLFWSEEIYSIFELDSKSFKPSYEFFLDMIHPDDRENVDKTFLQSVKNKTAYKVTHRIITKSGTLKYLYEHCETFYDDSGKAIKSVGSVQDVTEQKNYENKLKSALHKATESDRLKSAFLATMSHELRTPLNAIIGFSEFLDESCTHKETKKFGEVINTSGHRLLNIVEDLLDITLIEAGVVNILREVISLPSFLNDIHRLIITEQQIADKDKLEINLKIPAEFSGLDFYSDQSKLKQIILNLVKNALKFTIEGYINYGFTVDEIDNKTMLKFYVEDSGIGIPEEKREFIFDSFRQADDSHTREYGGVGIGLSISKKITELLGGKIWFETEVAKGTTFFFTIPLKEVNEISGKDTNGEAGESKLAKKIVLVVEDDEASYKFLDVMLSKLGMNIIWAKNAAGAIKSCNENTDISLVLMDVNLPEMNGFDATREIKKSRPDLPVIAQTAYALTGDREKSIAAGCHDYITKPINQNLMIELIKKTI